MKNNKLNVLAAAVIVMGGMTGAALLVYAQQTATTQVSVKIVAPKEFNYHGLALDGELEDSAEVVNNPLKEFDKKELYEGITLEEPIQVRVELEDKLSVDDLKDITLTGYYSKQETDLESSESNLIKSTENVLTNAYYEIEKGNKDVVINIKEIPALSVEDPDLFMGDVAYNVAYRLPDGKSLVVSFYFTNGDVAHGWYSNLVDVEVE